MTHRLVVPFKRWHYDWLAGKSVPGEGYTYSLSESVLAELEQQNWWTGVVDGEPLVCGGAILRWPGRHELHAYLAQNTGPYMLWITREVKNVIDRIPGRLEFTVLDRFAAGHKWARLLGFEVETSCLKQYGPQGEDHVGYYRLNK